MKKIFGWFGSLSLVLCCALPVFASSTESEFTVPEATAQDYLFVLGVWMGSMALAMVVYYFYLKWKRKKRSGGRVDKTRKR